MGCGVDKNYKASPSVDIILCGLGRDYQYHDKEKSTALLITGYEGRMANSTNKNRFVILEILISVKYPCSSHQEG